MGNTRPIKFRAFDTITKKYMWPWPDGFSLFGEVTCFDLLGQQFAEQKRNTILSFNDLIIEQFTGLHDKNGREIYEGDIFEDSTGASVIVWNPLFASFCLRRNGWAFDHFFGEAVDPWSGEVIGNIHENPELLK